ncbi:SEL1-like repeat protein [Methylobacterium nodulans]|uniref:Sel1 domain protein repeat-containing protein n=1 Tax=Methylobacterium nodulans (strain LMG 21967 / CNCM I-2342 / ORS 2060) TaxID=460265 RepID=B8ILD5_METNO|nr:SEL1-like repeat protein [Methylobacterium nodulans]ACL60134.1 Sel1 domain protein repeat-containing protein [Methylobacterium nodulans ORS 2060]
MRRNAPPSLDAFDPDVRQAAREAARRAGMSVEDWLAATISQESARIGVRTRARAGGDAKSSNRAGGRPRTEALRDSGPRFAEPPRLAEPPHRERAAAPIRPAPQAAGSDLGEAFAAMTRRLDEIDRRLNESIETADRAAARAVEGVESRLSEILREQAGSGDPARLNELLQAEMDRRLAESREVVDQAVVRAVEGIEARLQELLRTGSGTAEPAGLQAMLQEFEARITALGERIAASGQRPIGRRGLPVQDELRAAVAEIRQRQQQLEEADGEAGAQAEDVIDAMRRDLNRVADSAKAASEALSPAIAGLQAETMRLRDSVTGLATSRDLGAMEQAFRTLADEVKRARQPEDLAGIAGTIDLMRMQVNRLADDVAANVHGRLVQDVESLSRKVDSALNTSDAGSLANRDAIANLFRELDAIRRQIAALATPERIQSLAHSVEELNARIADLCSGVAEQQPIVAEIKPLLEEIRSGLRAPGATAPAITRGLADLDRKLDDLRAQAAAKAARDVPDAADDIIGRIDALSEKVDKVATGGPVGAMIERLEQIGDSLRRPAVPGGDLASIHGMLRALADKLDRVGEGAGSEALDGLEKQVLALASRIDTRGSDPALAGLERTMGDLLAQVALLREEAPIQAAAERAARHAVADTIGAGLPAGAGPAAGQLGTLQATLAELRAQQEASERRMQATMEGVHTALERLVARLSQIETERPRAEAAPAMPPRRRQAPTVREALPESVAAPARPGRGTTAPSPAAHPADEMLEPGASRPRAGRPASEAGEAAPDMPAADIKANFIAAARRAAQAAAAEAASGNAAKAARGSDRGDTAAALRPDISFAPGLVGQLRATLDRRRRPLLLGLAAVVLALGTLQALNGYLGGPASPPAPLAARSAAETAAPADPATTQALGEVPESELAKPAARIPDAAPVAAEKPLLVPRVAAAASLGPDLAGLPASFASLRQAALDGDGAALYELASREADGRGTVRDLALAAKLFERLASLGYAPAQYRLGSQYEKGMGVTRDVSQARLWYGKAAEQGHVRAMHNLAVLMAESGGAGGKPDYAAAAAWFRRASEFGVRDSQYNLAVLLARGLGVPQDLGQSYGWFAAAAAQGDDDAGRKRDEVAAKLGAKELAAAKAAAEAWNARLPDPAVNEPPPPRPEPASAQSAAPMSLIGAPPPVAAARPAEAKPRAGKAGGPGV